VVPQTKKAKRSRLRVATNEDRLQDRQSGDVRRVYATYDGRYLEIVAIDQSRSASAKNTSAYVFYAAAIDLETGQSHTVRSVGNKGEAVRLARLQVEGL
jgi:hypothetical protein